MILLTAKANKRNTNTHKHMNITQVLCNTTWAWNKITVQKVIPTYFMTIVYSNDIINTISV